MMRTRARTLLIALALATPTTVMTATSGVAAGAADHPAQFSQNAASAAERQMFGSELIGKVTKAGKVGNIDAKVGDVVLREANVPTGRGGRATLGPASVAAATVLHGQHIRTIDKSGSTGTPNNYRIVVAVQENQSKQVRAYAKGHLYRRTTGAIVSTNHGLYELEARNYDYDSAGDGCGPYPTGGPPCIYTKNPSVGESVLDYYALGQYRHKCGQEGWGCNNEWSTLTSTWTWYDPASGIHHSVGSTCSYIWHVQRGQGSRECPDE